MLDLATKRGLGKIFSKLAFDETNLHGCNYVCAQGTPLCLGVLDPDWRVIKKTVAPTVSRRPWVEERRPRCSRWI